MFPFTRKRKTKTNILATECAFYSVESIPRRLNLWLTHVSLCIFTRGHGGGRLEGLMSLAVSWWELQVLEQRKDQRVREKKVDQDGREGAQAWGTERMVQRSRDLYFCFAHAVLLF